MPFQRPNSTILEKNWLFDKLKLQIFAVESRKSLNVYLHQYGKCSKTKHKRLTTAFYRAIVSAHESPWVRRTVESNWLRSLLVGKRWRFEARKSKLCLPLPLSQPQGPLPERRDTQPAKFFHFSSFNIVARDWMWSALWAADRHFLCRGGKNTENGFIRLALTVLLGGCESGQCAG